MFLHIHELMRSSPDEQWHVVKGFWVVGQDLENISCVQMFKGLASLRNWDWAKEAEDIEAVGDVGVALLTRHGQPSH